MLRRTSDISATSLCVAATDAFLEKVDLIFMGYVSHRSAQGVSELGVSLVRLVISVLLLLFNRLTARCVPLAAAIDPYLSVASTRSVA